jgi:hypothetical protein
MNKKRFAVIGLLLVVVLVLAACAPKEEMPVEEAMPAEESMPVEEDESMPAEEEAIEMEEPAEDEMTEESMEAEESEMAAEVDFEALIDEKVAGNHDLGRIFNADKTREEWETTIDRMIGYGAKINEEEKTLIIDYLLSR